MRETCISEQPMRRAISVWVRYSWKRRRSTFWSRSGSVASRRSRVAEVSAASKAGSSPPRRSASVAASPSWVVAGRSSESLVRVWKASEASRSSSSVQPACAASSCAVGLRPRSLVSGSRSRSIRIARSCRSRGGRTVEVKSRKHRRISRWMVGTANVLRAAPIDGSSRSSAFSSPIAAICSRSSSGTRLPRSKRHAIELASGR